MGQGFNFDSQIDLYFVWSNQSQQQKNYLVNHISEVCCHISYKKAKPQYILKMSSMDLLRRSIIILSAKLHITIKLKQALKKLCDKGVKVIVYPKTQCTYQFFSAVGICQIIEIIINFQNTSITYEYFKNKIIKSSKNTSQQNIMVLYFPRQLKHFQALINYLSSKYSSYPYLSLFKVQSKRDIIIISQMQNSKFILLVPSQQHQAINAYISKIKELRPDLYVIAFNQINGIMPPLFRHNVVLNSISQVQYLMQKMTNSSVYIIPKNIQLKGQKQYEMKYYKQKCKHYKRITTNSFQNIMSNQAIIQPLFIILDYESQQYKDFYSKIPAHSILISAIPKVCPAKQKNRSIIILAHQQSLYDLTLKIQDIVHTIIIVYAHPVKPNICFNHPSFRLVTNKRSQIIQLLKSYNIQMKYQIYTYSQQLQQIVNSIPNFSRGGIEVEQWQTKRNQNNFSLQRYNSLMQTQDTLQYPKIYQFQRKKSQQQYKQIARLRQSLKRYKSAELLQQQTSRFQLSKAQYNLVNKISQQIQRSIGKRHKVL